MIRIEKLRKHFGSQRVLRGVNLHVAEGEFYGLVGPNGAGKTTLLRTVATLQKPTSGEISIGGWQLPQHAANVRRHIGLVSHHALLYGDMSAAENLSFFARLYQLDRREERVDQGLRLVGLSARRRDKVRTFSRGMVQRLTIARATLHEPDVLLLDEPYTGLDQDASALLDRLLNQQSQDGRTILMITHNLDKGIGLCNKVAVLARGKIAATVSRGEVDSAEFAALYAQATKSQKNDRKQA